MVLHIISQLWPQASPGITCAQATENGACLFVFGYLKSKVTGQHPLKGALKVTAIGLLAVAAAYFVAVGFDRVFH